MELFREAKAICHPATRKGVNTYTLYRDCFQTEKKNTKCNAFLSASTDYSLQIDGELISFGQYSDYETDRVGDFISFTVPEIGTHKIEITVFSVGKDTSTARRRPSYLLYEITEESGAILAKSNSKTETAVSPCYRQGEMEMVSGQLGFTFSYDARGEGKEEWFPATLSHEETEHFSPRPIEKLSVSLPILPVSVSKADCIRPKESGTVGQRFVSMKEENGADYQRIRYDLGKETTGILTLSLECEEEAELLIGWGEHLDDGDVRAYIGGRNFCCSYYAKKGKNEFTMPFLRFGLRYLTIKTAKTVSVTFCSIRETLYPLPVQNTFRCNDEIHNRIADVALRTLHLCMHEHYEDCPWREQALYTMDSRNQMLCGYYAYGETKFPRASLRLIAESIREDGMLELCSPARVSITIPSFTAIFLIQLGEYLKYSKDITLFEELKPVALKIADAFLSRREDNGLIAVFKEAQYWNFYEWQTGLEGSISGSIDEKDVTYDLPLNAFVLLGIRNLCFCLETVGNAELSEKYRCAEQALANALEAFYVPEEKVYATKILKSSGEKFHFCELSQSLILYAGAVPEDRRNDICCALTEGKLISVTLSHSIFKYEALMQEPRKYAKWVFEKIHSIYGGMLEKGATSFWEVEEGASAFGNAGSLCHGWSAIPLYFYLKYGITLPEEQTGLSNGRQTLFSE